jgi:hypothetical protein
MHTVLMVMGVESTSVNQSLSDHSNSQRARSRSPAPTAPELTARLTWLCTAWQIPTSFRLDDASMSSWRSSLRATASRASAGHCQKVHKNRMIEAVGV